MQENDQGGFQPRDIAVALALLTRLPLRLPDAAYAHGAAAGWAYPLAGLVLGLMSGLAGWAVAGIGAGLAGIVAITLSVVLSGAMHEDGLADVADGFWGGWTPARRLEIMKDSHVGTYGMMALILGFAVRWWALTALFAAGHGGTAVIASAILSRAGMPVLMTALPNARAGGLSRSVGRPTPRVAAAAVVLALALAALVAGWLAIFAATVSAAVLYGLALVARAKIGGQTGDVLGASQQLAEITCLIVFVAGWG